MNEKLISGYAAYTTADEYGTDAVGDAPATTPLVLFSALVAGGTIYGHC